MIEATGTKVIIERHEQEQTTASGLVLTVAADPNPLARVLSVGPDVKSHIKVDDMLIIGWQHTAHTKYQGKTYYIVDESGIFGRVKS